MSKTNNRIEKRMPAGGKNISPEGIEKVLLADLDKIKIDAELDIFSNIMDKFREEQKAGNIPKLFGVDDWLKTKTTVELIEIGRGKWRRGGRVGMGEGGDPDKTFKPSPKDFVERIKKLTLIRSQLDPLSLKIIDELVEKSLGIGSKK
jgi:hypothetical protein|tara:strand:+ start:1026 stop:1469 length:444 start_codon:yes stop_codon:yes gene_type:complete